MHKNGFAKIHLMYFAYISHSKYLKNLQIKQFVDFKILQIVYFYT